MSLRLDARASWIALLTLLACATGLSAARAALATDAPTRPVLASVDITSAGPLTAITLGNELSCQVAHAGDSALELFPPSAKPGRLRHVPRRGCDAVRAGLRRATRLRHRRSARRRRSRR